MSNNHKALFSELALRPELHRVLPTLNYREMTPIQSLSLPHALSGQDVVAKAQTGSGKTLAFAISILNGLDSNSRDVSCLVLCPTRELAEQVAEQIRLVAKGIENTKVLLLCGGTPVPPQIASLVHGANIVVGTPGRVMDHILKRRLNLKKLQHFVLDEADRMLDMGFEDELKVIERELPKTKQTMLFSATFPPSVEAIVESVVNEPVRLEAESTQATSNIEQLFYRVSEEGRASALCGLLSEEQPQSAIVFCITKKETQQTAMMLSDKGFSVVALHGDLEQRDRTEMLTQFSAGSARILVATDVAARGLDIDDVPVVINYRLSEDLDTHTHRVGRTGRAGKSGLAISLVSDSEEIYAARIEEQLNKSIRKKGAESLRFHSNRVIPADFVMISISGGKKDKLRPGDILGALTQDANIPADDIGKIKITATVSFLAIKPRSVKRAMNLFREGRIKGRRFRARKLSLV